VRIPEQVAHRFRDDAAHLIRLIVARHSDAGGLMGHVNKVSHVFTLGHVAEMLGEDEDWLFDVAEEMDTENGQLWVVGVGEDGVMAFTDDGIENLKNLIAIHKDDPSIIEERRQALATMIKPKTEESDEV
jgi:hypothetical protein